MLKGNMLSDENTELFIDAKNMLLLRKIHKLEIRQEKHKENSWNTLDIFDHLVSEVYELKRAIDYESDEAVIDEIADVSNLCDCLAMVYLGKKRPVKSTPDVQS